MKKSAVGDDGEIPSTSGSAKKGRICYSRTHSDEASDVHKKPKPKLKLKRAMVVIPDLRDVLIKQAQVQATIPPGSRKRIPFQGVNSLSRRDKPEIQKRRNLIRLCKTGSTSPPNVVEANVKRSFVDSGPSTSNWNNGHSRSRALRRRQDFSRGSRDESVESESSKDVAFCKHCNKMFNVLDFALEHELYCSKNPIVMLQRVGDLRDNADEKVNFLKTLKLKPTPEVESTQPSSSETTIVGSQDARGGRIQRAKVVKQFKTYPVPLSSIRGQKIIAESGLVWHDHSTAPPLMLDDHCTSIKTRPRSTWPSTFSRNKKFKGETYAHQASFSKQQRVLRNSELVVGLSHKSWKDFNKCKQAQVDVVRLSSAEIAKYVKRPRGIGSKIKCRKMNIQVDDLTKQDWFLERFPFFKKYNENK